MNLRRRLIPLSLLLFALVLAAGCARVSRQRTLPPSIRTIEVPMFVNRTAEPGLEEDGTKLAQKEFLADGRLDLARQSRQADATIEVTLLRFDDAPSGLDSNDFPRNVRFRIEANVRIVQNLPGHPPLGGVRKVVAEATFNNDKRRLSYVPEPEGKRLVLERLAQLIVREVLTGSYTDDT